VRIPGVGKKTAERIVLELKEKLREVGADDGKASATGVGPRLTGLDQDVFSALVNLGCSAQTAEEAIRKAREKGTEERFEPLFRAALALVR
jgi:Holliday junction DNA helicase RuvA